MGPDVASHYAAPSDLPKTPNGLTRLPNSAQPQEDLGHYPHPPVGGGGESLPPKGAPVIPPDSSFEPHEGGYKGHGKKGGKTFGKTQQRDDFGYHDRGKGRQHDYPYPAQHNARREESEEWRGRDRQHHESNRRSKGDDHMPAWEQPNWQEEHGNASFDQKHMSDNGCKKDEWHSDHPQQREEANSGWHQNGEGYDGGWHEKQHFNASWNQRSSSKASNDGSDAPQPELNGTHITSIDNESMNGTWRHDLDRGTPRSKDSQSKRGDQEEGDHGHGRDGGYNDYNNNNRRHDDYDNRSNRRHDDNKRRDDYNYNSYGGSGGSRNRRDDNKGGRNQNQGRNYHNRKGQRQWSSGSNQHYGARSNNNWDGGNWGDDRNAWKEDGNSWESKKEAPHDEPPASNTNSETAI